MFVCLCVGVCVVVCVVVCCCVCCWLFVVVGCCWLCEGSGDVLGVLTLLVGGVAQAFHDDRVVELRVQLGVEEVEGKDREEQVEVEREK